ncbi:MAG: hypothetical protein A3K19_12595 [Lentisphaerae bacterium RIFOXYB12_FULL_65_16]|nr:MAG: hypothetical protein A3K18_12080 [Lentisphaerae bacterium RIFOXYA12_64_32]OGV88122.1 MAG: hypothetical protein A3K19_12595 [Lentisphaerae bacterium RIFOXYB12_FULL_65_16]
MPSLFVNCNWKPREAVRPALAAAVEIEGKYVQSLNHQRQALWVLDYEFATYGRVRVKSPRMPWCTRLPRVAHLYPPGTEYWEDTRQETGLRHSTWFLFSGGAEAGLGQLITARYGYARFLDATGQLGETIRQGARIGQRYGDDGFWRAQTLLCEALHLLLHAEPVEAETFRIGADGAPGGRSDLVDAVQAYIEEHITESMTVADIAEHVHVSVSGLAHRYREETGESPMATRARLRLDRAKSLLLKGQPLKAIAEQLGFSDAFHLSKAFKKAEGLSPREFLRKAGR